MKIVHICLAAVYIEGWGYQENILPKYHVKMGHNVTVLTSDRVFNNKGDKYLRKEFEYTNEQGIHVRVVKKYKEKGKIYNLLHDYINLYDLLCEEKPDLVFVHGGQFVSLNKVVKYITHNPKTKLCIDNHADYYNTPIKGKKGLFVHRYIFGHIMRKAERKGAVFYGVTPWRCDYLKEIYKLKSTNIRLLVMGGDDEHIELENRNEVRKEIRKKLQIDENDFLVITGGKLNNEKKVHLLMEAINSIDNSNIRLIIFGIFDEKTEKEFLKYRNNTNIHYIGWQSQNNIYKYYHAADLACFPGTHSVLWEQACSCGLPCLFRKWPGMEHVDVGGNVIFLETDDVHEIKGNILKILDDAALYKKMRKIAIEVGTKKFSYKAISEDSIDF